MAVSSLPALRPMRFDGDRRYALPVELDQTGGRALEDALDAARAAIARAEAEHAALAYCLVDEAIADAAFTRLGFTSLGAVPELVRALSLGVVAEQLSLPPAARAFVPRIPVVLPFGGRRRPGVRELLVDDPRVTRLWDRYSIDVATGIERNARWVGPQIWGRPERGYRVFAFEDGDRYVIRALCIFRIDDAEPRSRGVLVELLHDRTLTGMRAASHLVGIAVREMREAGADSAHAWSLVSSGSFPILARHGFVPRGGRRVVLGVLPFDPMVADIVLDRGGWYLSGLDFEAL